MIVLTIKLEYKIRFYDNNNVNINQEYFAMHLEREAVLPDTESDISWWKCA